MSSPQNRKLIKPSLLKQRSRSRSVLSISLLALVVSLSSCGQKLIKSLQDLRQLRTELLKEFHEGGDINVVIQNSSTLGVTFINSPLNIQAPVKRVERAQATVFFVKTHFAGIREIQRVRVAFVAHEARFVFLNTTKVIDSFSFDKNSAEFGPPASYLPEPEVADDQPRANFNPRRNETDVSIVRLQLSGNLDSGVALVPHFVVAGDATEPNSAIRSPFNVDFTFASYAPNKTFKTDVPFVIIADGATIYKSVATNTSATAEGGNEFLNVAIPFKLFTQMTRSLKVELRLGVKSYHLNEEQISALNDMLSYVPEAER